MNTALDPMLGTVKVKYPGGEYKEFCVRYPCKGSDLLRQVTDGISYELDERKYFSLCFYHYAYGTRHWVYMDRPIGPQLRVHDTYADLTWYFSLEVMLYPKSPSSLVDDLARNYMFLQLRDDVASGKLRATTEIHERLGAVIAQLEFGDAPSTMNDAYLDILLKIKSVPDSEETRSKIFEHHQKLRGITVAEAQNRYMDLCKDLPLYGLHFFPAKDEENREVKIVVGAVGINIFQDGKILKRFPRGKYNCGGGKYSCGGNKLSINLVNAKEDDKNSKTTLEFFDHSHARFVAQCGYRYEILYKDQ